MNIAYFGTPEFAGIVLEALIEKGYTMSVVITQSDKPVGKKKIITPSPVKEIAVRNSIPLLQPRTLRKEFFRELKKYQPDIAIVVAYGKIFPAELLHLPPRGCLNVHASLLPLYRGASPIQNAILNGDQTTGISLMQMNEGMDTGPVYATRVIALESDELFPKVSDRLAHASAELLIETLPLILKGTLTPTPQEEKNATNCQMIEKEDGRIYWNETAEEIFNTYRAFFLWPGIHTHWKRKDALLRLKLLRIRLRSDINVEDVPLGSIFLQESGVFVKTPSGSIELLEVQLEGKNPLSIRDFIRGSDDFIGAILQ